MNMTKKQEKVYGILLKPVVSDKKADRIQKYHRVIISLQVYYGAPDEDMCDFTLGFYKVLYGDNLLKDKELLNERNRIKNNDFAGDTMNSFNTIAKLINGSQSNEENIPVNPALQFYKEQYHCLANFWVIPMQHGRKSPKTVGKTYTHDSPVLYTQALMSTIEEVRREEQLCNFKKIHFLPETESPEIIKAAYKQKGGSILLKSALEYIDARAKIIIGNYDMTNRLYDYFQEVDVLEDD